MERSLNALIGQADAFVARAGTDAYRVQAGLQDLPRPAELQAAAPWLSEPETFQRLTEVLRRTTLDEDQRLVAQRVLELCAARVEAAQAVGLDEALGQALARPLPFKDGTVRVSEAFGGLPDLDVEAVASLERELTRALAEAQPLLARRVDVAIHTAAQLGFPSVRALKEAASGRLLEPWVAAAEAVLRDLEAPYADVLAYALRKSAPELKPAQAGRGHLTCAIDAPWLWAHFRREDVLHAVTRTFEDIGLPPNAGGAVTVDSEQRPGKRLGALALAITPPESIRVVVHLRGGFQGFGEVLHAFGAAQAWALVNPAVPILLQRLRDPATVRGAGALFELLLADEGWLKRSLRLPSATAREAARLFALRTATRVRRVAARLPHGLELSRRGPVAPLSEAMEDRLTTALKVRGHSERFLAGALPLLHEADVLRGFALAEGLRAALVERCNEDWWRNPASGAFLRKVLEGGGRDTAEPLAERALGRKLSLPGLSAQLTRVLGA